MGRAGQLACMFVAVLTALIAAIALWRGSGSMLLRDDLDAVQAPSSVTAAATHTAHAVDSDAVAFKLVNMIVLLPGNRKPD